MIIFKRQKLEELFRNKCELMVTNIGERKNYTVKRCIDCGLLFQTFKAYPRRICELCRYEKWDGYKENLEKWEKDRGKIFDEEIFYLNKMRLHQELQNRKDRINEAYKVTTINEPKCLRII